VRLFFTLWLSQLYALHSWAEDIIEYDYQIEKTVSHSNQSFTQGLALHQGAMIESSGLYGKSFIQRYTVFDNNLINQRRLSRKVFAEGITVFNNTLYLLTWKQGRALLFDPTNFEPLGHLSFKGQGWGLSHLGDELIMSNGTEQLTYRRPKDFSVIRKLEVSLNGQPLTDLNDLTTTDHQSPHGALIWANVWKDHRVFAIHPITGTVIGFIDLSRLSLDNHSPNSGDVLNGIVWDQYAQGFWVTGKRWKKRYLITPSH
jgi:glutaminyl-peptide cyclotransferase